MLLKGNKYDSPLTRNGDALDASADTLMAALHLSLGPQAVGGPRPQAPERVAQVLDFHHRNTPLPNKTNKKYISDPFHHGEITGEC